MSDLPTEPAPSTPGQRGLAELTQPFAPDETRPRARAVDEADAETLWDLWRTAAKAGGTGFVPPVEHGSGVTGVSTRRLVREELRVGGPGNPLRSKISDTGGVERYSPFTGAGLTRRAPVRREALLANAFAPEGSRYGGEGQDFCGLTRTFGFSRVVPGAAATGVARAAYAYAHDCARTREQSGKPVVEHQAVVSRLAGMRTRVERPPTARRAARRLDTSQALGGRGRSRQYLVEQLTRNTEPEEAEEATSGIMRLLIAGSL
ncbi:acyl-CoA dehydrogenase family protein [Streptomyces sp. NPDC058848]|uniref:acyl-CoA dehydrogenase family protein n=1 Tax=unclassified Streptomyces TaxID=2593676 RepID=UPI0036B7364A